MAHRYRLVPTPDQLSVLARHCADARYVWNTRLHGMGRASIVSACTYHLRHDLSFL
jgi:hypothetical protein